MENSKIRIFDNGYGKISKFVMTNKNLNKTSRLIYAYLCSFGAGISPTREEICLDLKIGTTTLSNSLKELKKLGYINIESQRNSHGYFSHNVYTINTVIKI